MRGFGPSVALRVTSQMPEVPASRASDRPASSLAARGRVWRSSLRRSRRNDDPKRLEKLDASKLFLLDFP